MFSVKTAGVWITVMGAMIAGAGRADACPGNQRAHVAKLPTHAKAKGMNNTIVGVWQVTYSTNGSVWDMSFDSWHSDGTENDNDMAPPSTSAVCEGVWEWTGPRTVKLHHVGWVWDPSGTTLIGTFTLDEANILSSDGNSYSGSFTFQVWGLDGSPIGLPTLGQIEAERITVP